MNMRFLGRRVAAGAAAGLLLTTLVCGGAAVAAEHEDAVDASVPLPVQDAAAAATDAGDAAPPVTEPATEAPPAEAPPAETPAVGQTEQPTTPDADPVEPVSEAPSPPPSAEPEAPSTPAPPAPAALAPAASMPAALAPAAPAPLRDSSPAIVIDMPAIPASGWFTGHVNLEVDSGDPEDDVVSITYQVDGREPVVTPGTGVVVQLFTDGRHTFTAWATDAEGNQSAPHTRSVDIDRTGPTASDYSLPPGSIVRQGAQILFTYRCEDALSGLESCVAHGRLPDWTLDTSTLGEHTIDIVGVDKAGNTRTTTYAYRVADDNTAPRVTATVVGEHPLSPDWSVAADTSVLLQLQDDVPEQTVLMYRVGSSDWQAVGGSTAVVPVTADGVFDLTYVGYDAVGNASQVEIITVGRDTVAPSLTMTASDAAGAPLSDGATVSQGDRAEFALDCADETSGVRDCDVDGVTGGVLDTASVGSHEVVITARDIAGNPATAVFTYTVKPVVVPPPVPGEPEPPVPGQPAPGEPAPGEPAPAPAEPAPTEPLPGGLPEVPAVVRGGAADADDDRLAATGGTGVAPVGLAGMVLLIAGTILAMRQRRRRVQ